ncbi:MAG: coproporphyrinogen dehydrogenase [Coriobacteriaceae bacterium]|nr:coproporphyrinogen dehydrogenase [Coriobacteriaceae bacterium]
MLAERVLTAFLRQANSRYLEIDHSEAVRLPDPEPGRAYMLYAHVPFCVRLCPYCSFNRFPYSEDIARTYFAHLRDEMRIIADKGFHFGSMYVGGGTPTVLVDELCHTIDLARELFGDMEVSSETNPNHLTPEYTECLAPRVHRFSVGVQSFDDGLLKQMDRYERYGSGAQVLQALADVAGVFKSLNVDLIFNFPNQTEAMLRHDIDLLKASGADQVTMYPLMVSPAVRRSLTQSVGKVDYAREEHFYQVTSEALADVFEPSSAWCFSRVGGGMIDEYIVDYDEYVGVGSGAFSFLGGSIYTNSFSLREYGEAVEAHRTSVTGTKRFSTRELMRYRLLMGLFGLTLDKRAFERDFGVPFDRAMRFEAGFMRAVGAFARDDADVVALSPKGRYLLVAMMREFFAGVNNLRDQARAALPDDEQHLLFDDERCDEEHSVAAAAAMTHTAEDLLPPNRL